MPAGAEATNGPQQQALLGLPQLGGAAGAARLGGPLPSIPSGFASLAGERGSRHSSRRRGGGVSAAGGGVWTGAVQQESWLNRLYCGAWGVLLPWPAGVLPRQEAGGRLR